MGSTGSSTRVLGAKVGVLTDSRYLQHGANGKAQHWKSKGWWTTASGALKANVPVWELLLHKMNQPGRQVQWEHVPAHVNLQGTEIANGLAMERMCSDLLRSRKFHTDSGLESTLGLRGGLDSEAVEAMWEELGLQPMDSEEMTGEASGAASTEDTQTGSSSDSQEDSRGGGGVGGTTAPPLQTAN